MKVTVYIFAALLLTLSQVYADVCNDALIEFENETQSILDKRMVAYDDVVTYRQALLNFKSQIRNQPCAHTAINQTQSSEQKLKQKRIETLERYLKLGIKEEAGQNLEAEYQTLTGQTKKPKTETAPIIRPAKPAKPAASSAGCSDVILENEAVNLKNVRNQDSVGWCYAYTAADLLSFKLKKRISAVSLYHSGQDIEKDVETANSGKGGDVGESIRNYLARKNGLCLEDDLPSNDFKFCTDKRYYEFLNNLINAVKEQRFADELNNNQCFGNDLQAAFPGVDMAFIQNHSERFGARKLIEAIFDQQCKTSFKGIQVNVTTITTNRYSPVGLVQRIDEQLSKGQIAGIAYDHNKLNSKPEPGGHASIVVGRRNNPLTNSCEYLVRNSWGKDCEQNEGEGLSCHKNCDSAGCRYSGHFWVSTDRLKQVIEGVMHL